MNTKEVKAMNYQTLTDIRQKKVCVKETNKNYLPKSISRLGGKRSFIEEIKIEKKS